MTRKVRSDVGASRQGKIVSIHYLDIEICKSPQSKCVLSIRKSGMEAI